MERDYKYEPGLFCEGCGTMGGYDLMGDILCEQCMSSMGVPFVDDDTEPVYATLHFYYNDQESMRRFRKIQRVDDFSGVLFEFDQWLRYQIKYAEYDEYQPVRDEFWKFCEHYGVDPWEDE